MQFILHQIDYFRNFNQCTEKCLWNLLKMDELLKITDPKHSPWKKIPIEEIAKQANLLLFLKHAGCMPQLYRRYSSVNFLKPEDSEWYMPQKIVFCNRHWSLSILYSYLLNSIVPVWQLRLEEVHSSTIQLTVTLH